MKTGRPKVERPACILEGCDRLFYGRGYCRQHFLRWQRNGDPGPAKINAPRGRNGIAPGGPCSVNECGRVAYTRGLCNGHYLRLLTKGDVGGPKVGPKTKTGGRWMNSHGYMIVIHNGEAIKEHRLVMETRLGRKLLPEETVHHKNGVKTDNRDENLELWSKNHPAGQRVEDLLAWADHIRAIYGGMEWRK